MTPTTTLRNFKSITKFSYIGLPLNMREQLTANRTYYVSTTGNDSNNGLTVGAPFLTIQKAVDVVCGTIDMGNYNVTVQLADGTYTNAVALYPVMTGKGIAKIQGNVTTPANTLIDVTSTNCVTALTAGTNWTLKSVKIQTSTASGVTVYNFASLILDSVSFGTVAGYDIYCLGGYVLITGTYTISGNATAHVEVQGSGVVNFQTGGVTINFTGAPNFSSAFIEVVTGACSQAVGITFTGTFASVTGKRYNIAILSVIQTNSGANYFPGNVAGTATQNSIYA
jgi:hypothetical protein